MASSSKITGPKSINASHDADAGYTAQVTDNIEAAVNAHLATYDNLVDRQVAVLNNKNASAAQKATSMAIGVSETMMAGVGVVMGAGTQLSEAVMMPVMEKLAAFKGTATLPVCKQMDPVMGIDVHMVVFPPVPAPVPIPHPYVGISFRAKDFVACALATVMPTPDVAPPVDENSSSDEIDASNEQRTKAVAHAMASMAIGMLGATVKFGGYLPRTVAGTPTKTVVSHFPIGPQFHPVYSRMVEKDHGHALLGSFFVVADGSPLTGAPVHLHNDCWDVGIFSIHNTKPNRNADGSKKLFKARLYVPSGVIMPIPWTRPVLTNPVPAPINPLTAPLRAFQAAFAKLKRAAKKKIDDNRKKNEERIAKSGLPCAAKTMLSKLLGTGQSHPVDVSEGYFYTDNEDFSLPGPIPLSWERTWYSYSDYEGPLGYGWHHSYDIAIGFDHDTGIATMRMSDGRGVDMELPGDPVKPTYNRKEKLRLFLNKEENYYYVKDANELIYRFTDNGYAVKGSNAKQYLLRSISNANGFAIRFSYDYNGKLAAITDSADRKLIVENDDNGRITAIYAPHPQLVGKTFAIARYVYDEEGDMINHTDALGQAMLFEYKNHLMVREVWRNGLTWQFVYNGNNRKAKCVEAWGDNDLLHYKFDYSDPQCTLVRNSLGHIKTFYHRNGLVTKYIDPNGAHWEYRYNRFAELESQIDPLGNQTSWTHDDWGNIVTSTDPAGGFNSTEYFNPKFPFLPTEAMDAAGGKWKWEYDENGSMVESINPLGGKMKYKGRSGNIDGDDQDKNLDALETTNEAVNEYIYDVLGNCIKVINPQNVTKKIVYDLLGRVIRVDDFDGNVINLKYDELSNLVGYRDKYKDIQYTYRGLGHITSCTVEGATTYFYYNTEEQLYKIVSRHGLPYKLKLDACGKVIEETGFDGQAIIYERNAAGWVTKIKRVNGKITYFSHDNCGRVTRVQYSDKEYTTFKYRQDGTITNAANEVCEIELQRNFAGNIIKESINGEWIASEYDNFNNRIRIKSSFGADIKHNFNTTKNISQLEANNWIATFKYNKSGLETECIFPGGVGSQWKYDKIDRPVENICFHAVGDTVDINKSRQYYWDVNSRLKQIKETKGVRRFEHDSLGRLSKTMFPNGEVQYRNPDTLGNIFSSQDRKDRIYTKDGQLKKTNNWQYIYDEEGNLIEKKNNIGELWKYEWNDKGFLVKVTRPDKNEVTFEYDAFGRRIMKKFKNKITKFIWDCDVPLHEWNEYAHSQEKRSNEKHSEENLITWIFNPHNYAPIAKLTPSEKYSIVTDHLGTPILMYESDGSLIWDTELDSNGNGRVLKGELLSCPFRYQGQYEDFETNLFYNRFRYYAPGDGVYISKDPIRLYGGYNFYSYVEDTTTLLDIYGLRQSRYGSYDSADEAARRALKNANRMSIRDNYEYGGLIYELNGRFHPTQPRRGNRDSVKMSAGLPQVPPGARIVGDYHTHGDYSQRNPDGTITRTSDPRRDDFNSDQFSPADRQANAAMRQAGTNDPDNFSPDHTSYLGTPSGENKVLRNGNQEDL